jgi:hypothetical protein
VFRDVQRPAYDELSRSQIKAATEKRGVGDIMELLRSGETWEIR